MSEEKIGMFFHCKNCLGQLGTALEVGASEDGEKIIVRCMRCDLDVGKFKLATPLKGLVCADCEAGRPHSVH